jgi:hypothetical protein
MLILEDGPFQIFLRGETEYIYCVDGEDIIYSLDKDYIFERYYNDKDKTE